MSINQQIAELRVTIEEIAAAKGISYREALDRIFGELTPPPPLPPTPVALHGLPHQFIDDSGTDCVKWCQACKFDRYARTASRR